jgi:hypothetical protein
VRNHHGTTLAGEGVLGSSWGASRRDLDGRFVNFVKYHVDLAASGYKKTPQAVFFDQPDCTGQVLQRASLV